MEHATILDVGLSPLCRARLLEIARAALLEKLNGTDAPLPLDAIPSESELTTPAGCFVSLHQRSTHNLRGCVGRIDAHLPLWENVRHTAGEVLHDPRFAEQPVVIEELADLEIEVSVLSPPRQANTALDFDLLEDGIYLIFGGRAGFFLPQVARETRELLDGRRRDANDLCAPEVLGQELLHVTLLQVDACEDGHAAAPSRARPVRV